MSRYLMSAAVLRRRYRIHGQGYIAGVSPGLVTVDGSPASRDVTLLLRCEQRVVARTLSKTDGTYAFTHLATDLEFVVYAWDRFNEHNAAIADRITPVLMPEFE